MSNWHELVHIEVTDWKTGTPFEYLDERGFYFQDGQQISYDEIELMLVPDPMGVKTGQQIDGITRDTVRVVIYPLNIGTNCLLFTEVDQVGVSDVFAEDVDAIYKTGMELLREHRERIAAEGLTALSDNHVEWLSVFECASPEYYAILMGDEEPTWKYLGVLDMTRLEVVGRARQEEDNGQLS